MDTNHLLGNSIYLFSVVNRVNRHVLTFKQCSMFIRILNIKNSVLAHGTTGLSPMIKLGFFGAKNSFLP